MTTIHSTAIVDPGALLGENVSVGPFSIINNDVIIGDDSTIASHVFIQSGTRIGKKCR
ncbi:MAG: acyl-[acyl-carrier-protein]--UDP-N-acetylglucosamine O-acyltransferase, partial [bacterium]|nr:acyl-[acyl-carrier-protein]--UDP-N-acetylglucosamine O-acyltransferase [bacterium]